MTTSSYQQIAKEILELWQKQLSTVASDKQFIHAMLDMMQTMQKGDYARSGAKPADTHPSPASDDANGLAELAFRLAMCEKRLAALEAKPKPGKTQKNPAKRSRKPRR